MVHMCIIMSSFDAIIGAVMRTTVTLDNDLYAKAQLMSGLEDRATLLKEALKALIERESARRLMLLGGSELDAVVTPRRRDVAV